MSDLSAERLTLLHELRQQGPTTEPELVVRLATERLRELFEAEGTAVILLDGETNELYFPVVRDHDRFAQLRVSRTRFPADQGIAGWVLAHDESVLVADAQNDQRFFVGIDQKSKMTTRSLLCAPLRTPDGIVGVLEIVNPEERFLTLLDLQFLELIADEVSTIYQRVPSAPEADPVRAVADEEAAQAKSWGRLSDMVGRFSDRLGRRG